MTTAGPEVGSGGGRSARLALLARAEPAELGAAWERLRPLPDYRLLRPGETGLVMVRGRAGATGRQFNLGEVTVSRASARLEDGRVGHGYLLGRRRRCAERIAVLDALLQADGPQRADLEELLATVRARLEGERTRTARRAAATRVEFFTMAREGGA
ncbi:phosphonate C-P lyase system protein PhnG [Sediminicurvatus halobius]|uniref:Phosphonate C-P lyase system protein PhnG n=1 Tax=Sediminicurvatus halobius TaxID=2182432 RepID=A0A2U2MWH0_9GAMM|nr:phosphonate C-P lyase system protein PhnG [Spiribacter halobius]PWG61209.1 phosphonate C-P lyase system protein PhnG [Spiribacter halobius]UEX77947.1 phosphonate C-P lyase system protein PhnG [Spiribacter halobius]